MIAGAAAGACEELRPATVRSSREDRMLRLLGLKHDTFEVIEVLNPRFVPGAPKIRITVDTEAAPRVSEPDLAGRLLAGFPRLSRHECRVGSKRRLVPMPGTHIRLVENEHSANQAHLIEHIVIDLLSVLEPSVLRSGVTCAWVDPPERNDVFVECGNERMGVAAALLSLVAMESALDDRPLTPLFEDLTRVWKVISGAGGALMHPHELTRRCGLSRHRVEQALALLKEASLVAEEAFGLNVDAEPHYRPH
jgi:hypothetical protein